MKPLPELETSALSAKTIAAIKAFKWDQDRELAAKYVKALVATDELFEAFETWAKELVTFSLTPDWQHQGKVLLRTLWRFEHVAAALRNKNPDRIAKLAFSVRASVPRRHLMAVLKGMDGAPMVAAKQLATLVEDRNADRLELYTGFEALLAADPKKLRALLGRPAKTGRDKMLLDIACDTCGRTDEFDTDWAPLFFPHVIGVDEIRISIERPPEVFASYLAWAVKNVEARALAKYLNKRFPELRSNGKTWFAAVLPSLTKTAAKLGDKKLSTAIAELAAKLPSPA